MNKPKDYKTVRIYLSTHRAMARLAEARRQNHAVIMDEAVKALDMEVGGERNRPLERNAGKPAK